MTHMTTTTTTTCPLCSRQFKVKTTSKLGRHIPRHGHRGPGGGGACPGSLLDADNPLPGAIKEQKRIAYHWHQCFKHTGKRMHKDAMDSAEQKLIRLERKLSE